MLAPDSVAPAFPADAAWRARRGDPLEQVVVAVVVHQETDRAQLHAVDRISQPAMSMHRLQHEAVAAERAEHVRLFRLHVPWRACNRTGLRASSVGLARKAMRGAWVLMAAAYRPNVGADLARDALVQRKHRGRGPLLHQPSCSAAQATMPSVLGRQLRQPLHRHRKGRIVERLLRRQLVEHAQGEAQGRHRRVRSSDGPWRRRWRPASTSPGR